jgi:hypothetical protein
VLELGDQQVVFVRVGDDRYAAELDGKRRLIRTAQQKSDVYENGDRVSYKPTRSEGSTANIDTILRCLALGAAHSPLPRGVELSAKDNWGHFRQNTFLTISITIAESGSEVVTFSGCVSGTEESAMAPGQVGAFNNGAPVAFTGGDPATGAGLFSDISAASCFRSNAKSDALSLSLPARKRFRAGYSTQVEFPGRIRNW